MYRVSRAAFFCTSILYYGIFLDILVIYLDIIFMGIDKERASRLQGRSIDKKKALEPHTDPANSISREIAKEETAFDSRLLSKSPISLRHKTEFIERTISITIGMKVVQRDNPKFDWEVSGLHGNLVFLYNRNTNASFSKKIDRLIDDLNTPGSPWRLTD